MWGGEHNLLGNKLIFLSRNTQTDLGGMINQNFEVGLFAVTGGCRSQNVELKNKTLP